MHKASVLNRRTNHLGKDKFIRVIKDNWNEYEISRVKKNTLCGRSNTDFMRSV